MAITIVLTMFWTLSFIYWEPFPCPPPKHTLTHTYTHSPPHIFHNSALLNSYGLFNLFRNFTEVIMAQTCLNPWLLCLVAVDGRFVLGVLFSTFPLILSLCHCLCLSLSVTLCLSLYIYISVYQPLSFYSPLSLCLSPSLPSSPSPSLSIFTQHSFPLANIGGDQLWKSIAKYNPTIITGSLLYHILFCSSLYYAI